MATVEETAAAAASVERPSAQARLRSAARHLARRPGGSEAERSLLIVGAVCVPLGLVLILMGYWGAAHASRVIQQIPYELSGGVLGLALVFGGGFAYFGYWLSRIQREQRRLADGVDRQTVVLADALGRIEALLGGASGSGNGARPARLVRTPGGSLVHEPTCSVVARRDDLVAVTGGDANLVPCKICGPDVDGLNN
ncbi:MAG: hypothetical protein JWP02_2469 [Acidimicrobiales bacterium]|nr:hypothetical protein [Acidimicrobiales bacterium]